METFSKVAIFGTTPLMPNQLPEQQGSETLRHRVDGEAGHHLVGPEGDGKQGENEPKDQAGPHGGQGAHQGAAE